MNNKKEFYKQLLINMSDQAAEALANGMTLEIDHSRSGLKLFLFRRKHVIIQKQHNEATLNRK